MNKELEKAILKDELIIFVGAGVSMPFGFPNWINLVIDILKELKKEGDSKGLDLDYYINQGTELDVFDVLDKLENIGFKPKVKTLLYDKIKNVNIDEKDFSKIEKFWSISDKIITTNYDSVLEKGKPTHIDAFSNFNEFQQAKSLNGKPFLYKIHGDIVNPDNCILFNSDYKKLYKKDSSDITTLKNFITNKTILFIGFSFEDKFIKKQFKFINKLYKGHGKEHFIVSLNNKDLSKFSLKTLKIDNWEESFDSFLEDLITVKTSKKEIKVDENTEIDISTIDDINYLEGVLDEKKKEFDASSEIDKKKISKEMHKVSNRMEELFTQKMKINFQADIVLHNDTELELLFEDIFKSEKLKESVLNRINNIRDLHSGKHEWYHRSVIVSALACSLINHKIVDPKKIDLLIDFTTDTEDKVWQKAITYLFITLTHLRNKWVKYTNLKPKLESLKSQETIQNALNNIITLLQMNLYNDSFLIKNVFTNEYFKDSPFNYFLPFYKDNPSIDKVYEDDSIEDIDDYVDFIYNNPLPDSLKYLICNTKKSKETNNDLDISEEKRKMIRRVFNTHVAFNPYLNYVNEFFSFYKYFPSIEKEVKDKTDIVVFNNLKNYLLSKVEYHRAVARAFLLEENHNNAITQLKSLLLIKEKDEQALSNLASCYQFTKNIDEELKVRLNIIKLNVKNHIDRIRIANIYSNKRKFETSIIFYNEAIKLRSDKGKYFEYRGDAYSDLKNYEKSIKDYEKSINLGNDNNLIYYSLGEIYLELNDLDEALKYYDLASEKVEKNIDRLIYLHSYANVYRKKRMFEKAFEILKEAIEGLKNNSKAKKIDFGVIYGTKAAVYSDMNNEDKFYEFLEESFKCGTKVFWLLNDILDKYKYEERFKNLLDKYNQSI
ncbi:tetratricopeptide repeat protein [Tenacibaculum finnmarkense genomovar ulcerans]|uniref:SIR2 family protein n=1 Tax=Tenacibaculum finnmarkense TaxID=2781243 RepID=UPI00187B9F8E|nr:SIR2 family protein [Tenacibaculum finnmarkense]MBE7686817.1 tetratricopeptide repeat protein [Tenacibaculum finnmarkense genomovar ulcerans]